MHLHAKPRGFTLIELLVVIAIIGVLSSVVLASLNSARNKGSAAAVKAQLAEMRTSAELIYDTTGSYDTVCDATTDTGRQFRSAFDQSSGNDLGSMCLSSGTAMAYSTGGAIAVTTKAASPGKWAAAVQLKDGTYFCVDWQGAAKVQAGRAIDNSPLVMSC
jgi:prepilin-type N-terminal cleavage/methylation domain-containing protein